MFKDVAQIIQVRAIVSDGLKWRLVNNTLHTHSEEGRKEETK